MLGIGKVRVPEPNAKQVLAGLVALVKVMRNDRISCVFDSTHLQLRSLRTKSFVTSSLRYAAVNCLSAIAVADRWRAYWCTYV